MNIARLIPALVILMIALSPTVSAVPLELEAAEKEKTAYLGDDVNFEISLSNPNVWNEIVWFSVSGDRTDWIRDPPEDLAIPRKTSLNTLVELFPTGETPGKFFFEVTGTSYLFGNPSSSDTLVLNVIRPLDVEDFTVSKAGDELFLNILMDSKDRRPAELSFAIINNRGEFLKRFSLDVEVNGLTMIEESVPLPEGMFAGDYNVELTLVGTPVVKEYMFTILPIHNVVEVVKKTSTAWQDEVEVTITNHGNLVERQYVSYKTVPNNDWVTGLVTEPNECYIRNGEKTCKYVFSDLAPGDEVTLSYVLDYTSVYATYGIALIAVFMAVLLFMRRATAPVIIKRHVRKSGGRHHVVLEVRNPFYHNLSNAIVRDWVSPLANVLHHEISAVKPLMRRSDAGTELIWKLGDIRPRETRIITYPLKALVKGSLKMPRAYIRFNKPNGKLKRLFSKTMVFNS